MANPIDYIRHQNAGRIRLLYWAFMLMSLWMELYFVADLGSVAGGKTVIMGMNTTWGSVAMVCLFSLLMYFASVAAASRHKMIINGMYPEADRLMIAVWFVSVLLAMVLFVSVYQHFEKLNKRAETEYLASTGAYELAEARYTSADNEYQERLSAIGAISVDVAGVRKNVEPEEAALVASQLRTNAAEVKAGADRAFENGKASAQAALDAYLESPVYNVHGAGQGNVSRFLGPNCFLAKDGFKTLMTWKQKAGRPARDGSEPSYQDRCKTLYNAAQGSADYSSVPDYSTALRLLDELASKHETAVKARKGMEQAKQELLSVKAGGVQPDENQPSWVGHYHPLFGMLSQLADWITPRDVMFTIAFLFVFGWSLIRLVIVSMLDNAREPNRRGVAARRESPIKRGVAFARGVYDDIVTGFAGGARAHMVPGATGRYAQAEARVNGGMPHIDENSTRAEVESAVKIMYHELGMKEHAIALYVSERGYEISQSTVNRMKKQ